MSALPMALLTMGVLAGLAGVGSMAASWFLPWGAAGTAAALLLIIIGAAGMGRGITAGAPQEADRVPDQLAQPARLTGHLDPGLSRWLWLVKWIVAILHYIVLAVLWIAFLVVTVVAGLVILLTGRYPASLFQFTVGVLRWNWRVAFYAVAAAADRGRPHRGAHGPHRQMASRWPACWLWSPPSFCYSPVSTASGCSIC